MISIIYKCDKCGVDQSTKEQFWELSAVATHLGSSYLQARPCTKPYQVCRKCLEHMGIYTQKVIRNSPEFNPPTIEELLKEIILRTIEENQDHDA